MAEVKKFLFDRSFDADAEPKQEKTEEELPESPEVEEEPEEVVPTFSQEELDSVREAAFAQGREDGIREAANATERRVAELLETVGGQLAQLLREHKTDRDEALKSAISVAAGTMHKVFPEYTRRFGTREVEAMIEEIIQRVLEEPRLLVRVDSQAITQLEGRIEAIAEARGFEGKVTLLEDPDLPTGDCRVEWGDGGAERQGAALWQEIDEIIERNLEVSRDSNGLSSASGMDSDVSRTQNTEPTPAASSVPEGATLDEPAPEPASAGLDAEEFSPEAGSGGEDMVHMTGEGESAGGVEAAPDLGDEIEGVAAEGMTADPKFEDE